MPTPPSTRAATSWTVCSVPIRTRDGAERLDQAYRRLLDGPPSPTPFQPEVSPP
jgi:hypothetical protein